MVFGLFNKDETMGDYTTYDIPETPAMKWAFNALPTALFGKTPQPAQKYSSLTRKMQRVSEGIDDEPDTTPALDATTLDEKAIGQDLGRGVRPHGNQQYERAQERDHDDSQVDDILTESIMGKPVDMSTPAKPRPGLETPKQSKYQAKSILKTPGTNGKSKSTTVKFVRGVGLTPSSDQESIQAGHTSTPGVAAVTGVPTPMPNLSKPLFSIPGKFPSPFKAPLVNEDPVTSSNTAQNGDQAGKEPGAHRDASDVPESLINYETLSQLIMENDQKLAEILKLDRSSKLTISKTLESTTSYLQKVDKENSELRYEVADLKKRLAEATSKSANPVSARSESSNRNSNEIKSLEAEVELFKKRWENAEDALQKEKERYNVLSAMPRMSDSELKARLLQAEQESKAAQRRIEELQMASAVDYKKRCQKLEHEIQRLQKSDSELLSQTRNEMVDLKVELKQCQGENSNLRALLRDAQDKAERMQRKAHEAGRESRLLEESNLGEIPEAPRHVKPQNDLYSKQRATTNENIYGRRVAAMADNNNNIKDSKQDSLRDVTMKDYTNISNMSAAKSRLSGMSEERMRRARLRVQRNRESLR